MPSVRATIGPVAAASARTWLAAARRTMTTVRARPELEVPHEVVAAFEGYLEEWSAVMDGDVFEWTGDVDADELRHLAAHWARLVALAREGEDASYGLLPADPGGAAFFDALAAAIVEALAIADDAERFASKFEEVVPAFDATVGVDVDGHDGGLRRVLLVDDNDDIRLLLRIGLETSGGFEVQGEARDGREAVELAARACPDVVLLDLSMPVMDGFEALPLLLDACAGVRVVIFSASDSPSMRERAERSGSHAFLRKDAAIDDVVEVLRSV